MDIGAACNRTSQKKMADLKMIKSKKHLEGKDHCKQYIQMEERTLECRETAINVDRKKCFKIG